MATKPRYGSVEYVPPRRGEAMGHYKCRITANDGSRPWIHLDPGPKSEQAEERARETAQQWSERAAKENIVGVPHCRHPGSIGAIERVLAQVVRATSKDDIEAGELAAVELLNVIRTRKRLLMKRVSA